MRALTWLMKIFPVWCMGLMAFKAHAQLRRLDRATLSLKLQQPWDDSTAARRTFFAAWPEVCVLLSRQLLEGQGPWGLGAFAETLCEGSSAPAASSIDAGTHWTVEVAPEKQHLVWRVKPPAGFKPVSERPPLDIRIPLNELTGSLLRDLDVSQALAIAILDQIPMFTRATIENVEWLRGPKERARPLDGLLPAEFAFFDLGFDPMRNLWVGKRVPPERLEATLRKRNLWAVGTQPQGILARHAMALVEKRFVDERTVFLSQARSLAGNGPTTWLAPPSEKYLRAGFVSMVSPTKSSGGSLEWLARSGELGWGLQGRCLFGKEILCPLEARGQFFPHGLRSTFELSYAGTLGLHPALRDGIHGGAAVHGRWKPGRFSTWAELGPMASLDGIGLRMEMGLEHRFGSETPESGQALFLKWHHLFVPKHVREGIVMGGAGWLFP